MIDRNHALPVTRQCQILSLARSTAYYLPQKASETDLALMRKIDELHLEYPFAGSRMLRDTLRQDGHAIGRKHVATLMKRMNIEAVYKKPNTSWRHPAHAVYPYLLRHTEISRPNHVFAADITYCRTAKTIPAFDKLRCVALYPAQIVVWASDKPRSAIISTRSRKLSL